MVNPTQMNQMRQMLQQLKANPAQFLGQRGIPMQPNMANPQQIIQNLMNSGKITQQQFDQARQMAAQMHI